MSMQNICFYKEVDTNKWAVPEAYRGMCSY